MSEPQAKPQTEAGRRMLRWLRYHESTGVPLPLNDAAAIAAIEAEARATPESQVAVLREALTTDQRIAEEAVKAVSAAAIALYEAVKCVPYHQNPHKEVGDCAPNRGRSPRVHVPGVHGSGRDRGTAAARRVPGDADRALAMLDKEGATDE